METFRPFSVQDAAFAVSHSENSWLQDAVVVVVVVVVVAVVVLSGVFPHAERHSKVAQIHKKKKTILFTVDSFISLV